MRLVLPKGRLLQGVVDTLKKVDMHFEFVDRNYCPTCSKAHVLAKLLKVRAIPQLVALQNFDIGFCGLDLVREADYEEVVPLVDLGLNKVEIVVAVPENNKDIVENPPTRPLLIATEYEHMADRWALTKNLAHITIQTYGSTEGYAPEDADIVFDCRETGTTLRANNLIVIEKLMDSSTWLVANKFSLEDKGRRLAIETLAQELKTVLSTKAI